MSELQKELVSASGFEPTKNYDRQNWLAALARQVNELPEVEFDALSVEAQDWFNEAVKALNKKKDVPDFEDAEETEAAADAEAEEGDPSDDEIPAEEETPPPKKAAKGKKAQTKPDEDEEAPAPKKRVPAPKKPAAAVSGADEYGVTGGKSQQAIKMLEKGCRMSDITEEVGGTYYNLIQRLTKDGHVVEKTGNGMLKLTHADKAKKAKVKK
jgi:hypothetical protein